MTVLFFELLPRLTVILSVVPAGVSRCLSLVFSTKQNMPSTNTLPAPSTTPKIDLTRVFGRLRDHTHMMARTSPADRKKRLKALKKAILARRSQIHEALRLDFGKSAIETDFSELLTVTTEITSTIANLDRWMRSQRVPTPITLVGNRSEVIYQPKGVVLIIAPWNFPVNLTLLPLVSAIAAGNTVCLKPSEFTPHSNQVIREIIDEVFPSEEVAVVEGGPEVGSALLDLPFHHIFFTGSPRVGKIVMEKAAATLASVTLELGGKSPAIVDETADLQLTANRLAWSKFYNAGQICIAPDYVLVPEHLRDPLITALQKAVHALYGDDPQQSPDYARIIHDRHFDFLNNMLGNAAERGTQVRIGGQTDAPTRYISPTVLSNVTLECQVMQEEIFGPILPILTYRTREEALDIIRTLPTPLACYIFSRKKANQDWFIQETRAGNTAVNTALAQFFNNELPFGGDHNSGFGKAHGYYGFLAFSNARSVLRQTFRWSAIDLIQPPFGPLTRRLADFFLRWF